MFVMFLPFNSLSDLPNVQSHIFGALLSLATRDVVVWMLSQLSKAVLVLDSPQAEQISLGIPKPEIHSHRLDCDTKVFEQAQEILSLTMSIAL